MTAIFSVYGAIWLHSFGTKRVPRAGHGRREALDLVDGDGLVDRAAGALGLAALVADAAADGRERIFLLDELKRVGVASCAASFR